MKALSIRNPWAWAICHAGKRVENREWKYPPTYRGPLLIHASAWYSAEEIHDTMADLRDRGMLPKPDGNPLTLRHFMGPLRGAIVARANLVNVVETGPSLHRWTPTGGHVEATCIGCGAKRAPRYYDQGTTKPCAKPDPWAVPGQLGFILADVVPLATPVPWKGNRGLFDVPESAVPS